MTPPPDAKHHQIARLVVAGAVLTLGLWVASGFLAALLWAVILAIAIDPFHIRLRQTWLGGHPLLLPLLITLLAALVVIVPLGLGVLQAAREAHDAATWIASAKAHGIAVPDWVHRLPMGGEALASWWQANLATPEAASEQLRLVSSGELLARSRAVGSNLVHRAVIFGFTLLTLFFVLRDRDRLIVQVERAADRLLGPAGERIGLQAVRSIRGTIDGLVLVGLGVGAVMAVAYFFLGVPHPLLFGALTAVAAMIPFAAPVLVALAALLLLVQGSMGSAIALVAIAFVVIFVADHFIRPALIGGATRLPFVWVLIGILGGVETLGLIGLFVGPAAMAVLVMLWREFLDGPAADEKVS